MIPSQLSISSTEPELPADAYSTELVVTFNRNLTNSEKTSFHATLSVEEQGGNEREYTLAYSGNSGYVSYNQEAKGNFVISGNTLTITMLSSVGFLDFTLG